MSSRLDELAKTLDASIRSGAGAQVRARLREVAKGRMPRSHAAVFARLAWRAHLPELGARFLNPIVRAERKLPIAPTDEEKIEYANCLIKLGASEEALALLAAVPEEKSPRASFALASAHFHLWDYRAALPYLERYVAARGLTDYERLVGRVNLAAVYVYERRHETAGELLQGLLKQTAEARHTLLEGNCLELVAYDCLMRKSHEEAMRYLDRAQELLSATESMDLFFVRKWKAVVSLCRSGMTRAIEAELSSIRAEARQRRSWETSRDLDRFTAITTRDTALLTHLWFGTPFESFREKLLADFGEGFTPSDSYLWRFGDSEPSTTFDIAEGKDSRSGERLNVGKSLHRLVMTLAGDFYRPFRIAPLFSALFPGEHYNPATSAARVHQTMKLLRAWLARNGVPLKVASDEGEYRLEAVEPCAVRIPGKKPAGTQELMLEKLRKGFSRERFSVQQAAELLDVSARTALRILGKAREEGLLQREGKTAGSRYWFESRKKAG